MNQATHRIISVCILASLTVWTCEAFAASDYTTSLPVVDLDSTRHAKARKGFRLPFFSKRQKIKESAVPATRLSTIGSPKRSRRSRRDRRDDTGPEHFQVYIRQHVLDGAKRGNTHLHIDIGEQRGYLIVDGEIGLEMPISTARKGKYTPRGTFRVTERVRSGKVSTIYGVGMPFWQRLDQSVIGVHAGYLPGHPASAGCVRLPREGAEIAFNHMASGVPVTIHETWSPEEDLPAGTGGAAR